jgi:hypothetical protein
MSEPAVPTDDTKKRLKLPFWAIRTLAIVCGALGLTMLYFAITMQIAAIDDLSVSTSAIAAEFAMFVAAFAAGSAIWRSHDEVWSLTSASLVLLATIFIVPFDGLPQNPVTAFVLLLAR